MGQLGLAGHQSSRGFPAAPVLGALSSLAVLLLAATAHAEQARFMWEAPAECPSAASVENNIVRYLGRPIQSRDASVWIRVSPLDGDSSSGEARGFRLELRLRTQRGERVRELSHEGECGVLARAAAVIAAIALDPSVMERLESVGVGLPSGPPEQRAVAPEAQSRGHAGEEPRPRRSLQLGVGAYALGALGALPGLGAGAAGGVVGLLTRLRVEVAFVLWLPGQRRFGELPSAGADYLLWAARARLCPSWHTSARFELNLCLGAELGRLQVNAVGLEAASDVRDPWLALTLAPGFAWRVLGPTYVVGGIELAAPLRRTRFDVDGYGELFRVGAVGLRGFVGGELRFR